MPGAGLQTRRAQACGGTWRDPNGKRLHLPIQRTTDMTAPTRAGSGGEARRGQCLVDTAPQASLSLRPPGFPCRGLPGRRAGRRQGPVQTVPADANRYGKEPGRITLPMWPVPPGWGEARKGLLSAFPGGFPGPLEFRYVKGKSENPNSDACQPVGAEARRSSPRPPPEGGLRPCNSIQGLHSSPPAPAPLLGL